MNIKIDDICDNTINMKKIIIEILTEAKIITGFDTYGKILMIDVFPDKEEGCIIYLTLIDNEKLFDKSQGYETITFEFKNIENVIEGVINFFERYGPKIYKSWLYKDNATQRYFLILSVIGVSDKKMINFLKEFSTLKSKKGWFKVFIDEHYDLIIKDKAIQTIYNNFRK